MPKERYYQDKKDKSNESRGMMKSMMEKEFYVSHDDSRRQQLEDSGMIREDRNAVANLPQEVIMRSYPTGAYGFEKGLNDTLSGIDMQMRDDSKEFKTDANPEKY